MIKTNPQLAAIPTEDLITELRYRFPEFHKAFDNEKRMCQAAKYASIADKGCTDFTNNSFYGFLSGVNWMLSTLMPQRCMYTPQPVNH